MVNVVANLQALIGRGYDSCEIVAQPSYRGSIYCHRIIRAKRDQRSFLAFEKDCQREFNQVQRIQEAIKTLRSAAKIVELIPVANHFLAVVEEVVGRMNFWEIESSVDMPTKSELKDGLDDLVERLGSMSWVHADIRPWNMFFDAQKRDFVFIDWWSSKRMDETNSRMDRNDADSLMRIFDSELTLEDAWRQPYFSMAWNPRWVRRGPVPPGIKPAG